MSLLAELAPNKPNDYTNYLWMTEDNNRNYLLQVTVEHDHEHVGHPHRRPSMSVLGLGLAKAKPNMLSGRNARKFQIYVWGL